MRSAHPLGVLLHQSAFQPLRLYPLLCQCLPSGRNSPRRPRHRQMLSSSQDTAVTSITQLGPTTRPVSGLMPIHPLAACSARLTGVLRLSTKGHRRLARVQQPSSAYSLLSSPLRLGMSAFRVALAGSAAATAGAAAAALDPEGAPLCTLVRRSSLVPLTPAPRHGKPPFASPTPPISRGRPSGILHPTRERFLDNLPADPIPWPLVSHTRGASHLPHTWLETASSRTEALLSTDGTCLSRVE